MEEVFLTQLVVRKVRNLENLEITLDNKEKKHLILTGKNGSGKTSLLDELKNYLSSFLTGMTNELYQFMQIEDIKKRIYEIQNTNQIHGGTTDNSSLIEQEENSIKQIKDNLLKNSKKILTVFNNVRAINGLFNQKYFLHFYQALRKAEFTQVSSITRLNYGRFIKSVDNSYPNMGTNESMFVQYLVNLRSKKAVAHEEKKLDLWDQLNAYFAEIESIFKRILGDETLKIEIDLDKLEVFIIQDHREKYSLYNLPAGYSAILKVILDILMNSEIKGIPPSELQGIAIIDEIENHLHVELQKRILQDLTSIFPRIQFIVSTHSPFILSSVENAVIYDLERKIRVEDLSGYSYEGIIESYFDVDQYSSIIKNKLNRYKELVGKNELSTDEELEKINLRIYLDRIPSFSAKEFALEYEYIKTQDLRKPR